MSAYDARLTDRVRTRGVLTPDDAARLLLPVAEAVAALHARGQAHGALSPDAVRVDAEGRATLIDRAELAPDPSYVAPDPSAGLHARPQADDVWALAAVLNYVTTRSTLPGRARDTGWLAPLVELALVTDPRERPTMADVADYLRARVQTPAARRRPSGPVLAIAGAAVIAGLGLLGAALLFNGSEDGDRAPRAQEPTSRASSSPDEPEPTATRSAEAVSAEDLEDFARDYVRTASDDPDRGFGMLTRTYQEESPRYREVWTAIQDPEILAVTPDPEALSVSYTYRYSLPGGVRRTEDITLRLVQRGDRLLIAGASARRP